MRETPKGDRLALGLFGRVNAGKSSLLNLIAGQDVSIVSEVPGTTTDVVEKAMELLPLGPVLLLDTAGVDDRSELAARRVERTARIFSRAHVAVLVVESGVWGEPEEEVVRACADRKLPLLAVVNKTDLRPPEPAFLEAVRARAARVLAVSSVGKGGRDAFLHAFKGALVELVPADFLKPPPLLADLVPAGGLAVFVVPIDLEAPKGRLILPQVQSIREALDADAMCVTVKESGLKAAFAAFARRPDLVVCDSQAVRQVLDDTPPGVAATTFSILFARAKGDLVEAARGGARLRSIRPGERVLVAEGCTHHAVDGDIGRVKLPRWLREKAGGEVLVDVVSGKDFPAELGGYRAVIHCGGCTLNRREMLSRVEAARRAGTSVTNYGVAIAALQGVARRVLEPFPEARRAYEQEEEFASRRDEAGRRG